MQKKDIYPILNKDYILRLYHIDGEERLAIYGIHNNKQFELNKDGAFLARLFTGSYSLEEITELILNEYPETSEAQAIDLLHGTIDNLIERKTLDISNKKVTARVHPPITKMRGLLDDIYVRLTNQCNLKCIHCSVNAGDKPTENLPIDAYYDLIDQIHSMMVPNITFTGGEPTLVKELPDLIQYATSKSIRCILMTNGLLITERKAEQLVSSGIVQVNVSLDGADEQTHDEFRGVSGSYKKALNAIDIFKKKGLFVETTTVIHEKNKDQLDRLLDMGSEMKLDKMKFLPIIPFNRGKSCNYKKSLSAYMENIGKFVYSYGGERVFQKI